MKKALSGVRPWLVQRLTAVYMLLFMVGALVYFAVDAPNSYVAWHARMTGTWVRVTTSLFFVALLLHAWVGLRDVVLDYAKPLGLRVGVMAALAFVLIGLALWMLNILLLARH